MPKKNPLEQALQESEVFYRHLAEHTPEALVIHKQGKIVYVNPSTVRLVRARNKEQLIGKPIMGFVHPDSKPLIAQRVKMMQEQKKVAPAVEEKFIDLKGNTILAEVKAVPFMFQGERAILAILRDITESKQTKEQLEQSEKRFRSLIEHSSDAIAVISPKGKVSYASPSIQHVLGYTPEEFVGKNGFSFVHPHDLPKVMKEMSRILLRKGLSAAAEVRVKHKNGDWIWVESTGTNLLTEASIRGVVANFRNITERKIFHERQAFLEKVGDVLISTLDYNETGNNMANLIVPDLADYCRIVVCDENGVIKEVAVNHDDPRKKALISRLYTTYQGYTKNTYGVEKILQTGKAELISKLTPEILKSSQDNPEVLKVLKKLELKSYMGVPLESRGKTIGAITFSSTQDGRYYTKDDLLFAKDVAHRLALALENAQLYQNAQKAITLRDEFISVASHELKTPVTSLKMYIQGLQKQFAREKDAVRIRYLEKIDKQIEKLSILISQLLNVSKMQHGQLELNKELFDLQELIGEAVEAIQPLSGSHQIIIKGELRRKVYADRERLYQVITNLLTNAIKYSPLREGTKQKKIIIHLEPHLKQLTLSVQDFGIGIDKEHQKKIFEQFYRVAGPEEKTYPGLGMGLYIVNEIIKRHGGTLRVTSQKQKGSRFTFTLPYDQE